jgi:hypothetical protein
MYEVSRLNPMRVCFLCNEYPPGPHGGIGTFTQMLARALVQAGHQAWVIGRYSQGHPGSDYTWGCMEATCEPVMSIVLATPDNYETIKKS